MSNVLVPVIAAAGHGLLLMLLLYRQDQRTRMGVWLGSYLAIWASTCVVAVFLSVVSEAQWLRQVATYGWVISTLCIAFLTLEYGAWRWWRAAVVGAILWLVALGVGDLLSQDSPVLVSVLDDLMLFPRFNLGGVAVLLSWVIVASSLLVLVLYGSARARLPLHANRLIYWTIVLSIVFVGQLLFIFKDPALSLVGVGLQLAGAGGLVYGVVSYRLFDVRGLARAALGHFLSTSVTAMLIVIAILFAVNLTGDVAFPILIGIAYVLAILYQIGRPWTEKYITKVVATQGHDPAAIVETYATTIGHILDIETLAEAAIVTISKLLGIRGGELMLVTRENEKGIVQPIGGTEGAPKSPMTFSWDDPFLSYFLQQRQPLLQYDMDVLPEYRPLLQEQREWLSGLQAAVFAPIISNESLIGLLAIGSMTSGVPYRTSELKLLQILAGQTVAALTNARLFDDMKKLNTEIQDLNEDMRLSNERLQDIDQVKTDFITIASHELRTPLTQIKGYVDILDAMVEDDTLASSDGQQLIERIGRATDQLEKVIGAMLDVSQIDVDAMALNLSEVRLDSVLRIALEPLVEAIRQRRLALTVRGFRDLPVISGDFQRLVQVVGNLASNAVKYTPDGGRITISADISEDQAGKAQHVELVFADTGVGVDPRDHQLIFDKFFRTYDPKMHSTGSTKFQGAGPGLGLPIVRGIVEAHGGRIWIESAGHDPENCPGSEFHIVLPFRVQESVQGSPGA